MSPRLGGPFLSGTHLARLVAVGYVFIVHPNVARRVLSAFLCVALTVSVLASGRAFLWCPGMQVVRERCCCTSKEAPPPDMPSVQRTPCCERQTVPSVPDGAFEVRDRTEHVSPAMFVALPPSFHGGDLVAAPGSVSVLARARERGARAGPSVPLYDLNAAYLI